LRLNVRHIQFLNSIFVASYFWFFGGAQFLWLTALMYLFYLGLGINIGFHRGMTHGVLEQNSVFSKFCMLAGVLTCMGKPSDWIMVHRLHHIYSDGVFDPHSPKQIGFWKVFTNSWSLSPNLPLKNLISIKRQMLKSPVIKFYDNNYWKIILFYCAVLVAFGGVHILVYAWSLPTLLALVATSLVNSFCHDSRGDILNRPLISLLTLGEGYHKFHHSNPKASGCNEILAFDVSGMVLKLIRRRSYVHGNH
jgi:sn-1 stearoyl-lipid 9-desaturase